MSLKCQYMSFLAQCT